MRGSREQLKTWESLPVEKHKNWQDVPDEQRTLIMDFLISIDTGVSDDIQTRKRVRHGVTNCIKCAIEDSHTFSKTGRLRPSSSTSDGSLIGILRGMVRNRQGAADTIEDLVTDNLERLLSLLVQNAESTRSRLSKV